MKKQISKLERTAYHEAGHAVVLFREGIAIRKISIIPDPKDGSLGQTLPCRRRSSHFTETSDLKRIKIEKEIRSFYGGMSAEFLLRGRRNLKGASDDLDQAYDLARYISKDEKELELHLKLLEYQTRNLLSHPRNWCLVEELARSLIEKRELGGKEVARIIKSRIALSIAEGWESLPLPPALLKIKTQVA